MSIGAFSFILMSATAFVVAQIALTRMKRLSRSTRLMLSAMMLAGIVALWLLIRPTSSALASSADFDQQLASGKPTVVKFFSEY